MIKDGIIYDIIKTRYLQECIPKTDIIQNACKHKRILTNQGIINVNIPPPPLTPPPRLPSELRIIQHVKRKSDRRQKIECRLGRDCWRHKKGICSYKHTKTSIETEV